jgi:hypothetical protein
VKIIKILTVKYMPYHDGHRRTMDKVPKGFHKMPDGSIMKGATHGGKKMPRVATKGANVRAARSPFFHRGLATTLKHVYAPQH